MVLLLLFPVFALADMTVTLAWDANTEADLAGYKVFYKPYGTPAFDYDSPAWQGTGATCTVTVPGDGQFIARAYDQAGNESVDSNVVVLDEPPSPVKNLLIQATELAMAALGKLKKALEMMYGVFREN